MTADAFNRNLKPFSERFQAISYDPRSHGRSTRLNSGNDYAQHGRDLAALIGKLGLKDAVLVGWSSGAFAAYAYFEQFGYQNARAFVSIDISPRPLMDSESDWGIDTRENVRKMLASATAPDAELYPLGGHMMFWEHPDRFNRVLSRFLEENLSD